MRIPKFSRFLSSSIAALALLTLVGCDTVPDYSDYTTSHGTTYFQMAPMAPPPPMAEAIPEPANTRSTVWRPGYWEYSGGSFHWVDGYIMEKPSATAVWSPDHWIKHTYGWAFKPGYWQ